MSGLRRRLRGAAQWVVDAVMGNGLAQTEHGETIWEGGVAAAETATLARRAAAEGCVLLANDGTLPLEGTGEVAVFGRGQFDWFAIGHGSGGDVRPPYLTSLIDGLAQARIPYNRVLAQMYDDWCHSAEHAAETGWWGHWPTCHPQMPVSPELAQAAAATAEVALVVIGRNAGEDQDLPLAPGGYYLSDEERTLIRTVVGVFAHTVVILNTSNVLDLAWVEEEDMRPSALLLAWQGGMEAGNAVADILSGTVNPCGRLACTIARAYHDYPSSTTFGNKRVVRYAEDVFVGYRHFDAHDADAVLFPFGHGLSYTSFCVAPRSLQVAEDAATVRVDVTNTGARAGREVVQLWCELAGGPIAKPRRVLAAFAKTRELAPDERQALCLHVRLDDLARYDESCHAWVLDAGSYRILANDVAVGKLSIGESRILGVCTPLCDSVEELRERIVSALPSELPRGEASDAPLRFSDVVDDPSSIDRFVAQLDDRDLEALSCGEGLMNSALGVAGNAGAFGGVTPSLKSLGVPAAICADGPSGARLQRPCTLLPSATTLACTWDVELVERLYALLGNEVRTAGVDVLLAPGMNIQRNPRCGRNFEYFSEDPLVTGRMATAVVRGLQSSGVSACPKHLACNNQERRRNTCDSRVSERALREIYLRGFHMCVRDGRPNLIMTSYNKVNGVWAHYHYDLVTTVLRNDWGFAGLVITDWWMRPARSPEFRRLRDNSYRIRASVDVLMPGSMSHVLRIMERPHGISRAELQRTAKRVLRLLATIQP
ncbi:MAG: glycoside hydrolase family 3 C-terminal domain-containing protein [Coriobacteriales bacterium]|nr:glycoside hydrolase family 3 C-terminal domain-containing protein [Coriobacteriales bacterium]